MSQLHLKPIEKPQGVRDRVTRALRAAIISGEMSPGRTYSAPMLGATLGVSATPIREAMLDLEKEGLVTRVPNRGFEVTAVDDQYLDEIAQLRMLIEPELAREIVRLVPEADVQELRKLAQAIVSHAVAHDLLAYTEADTAFHLALLEYAGNRRIVKLITDLRGQARLVGLKYLSDREELAASAEEHLEIVDAIAARDEERVFRLMRGHIARTRSDWAGEPGK